MGKTKSNRISSTSLTRARKVKTMKNMNSMRRSRGGARRNDDHDQEYHYGSEEVVSDADKTLEEVDDEENDNRWDFLNNFFSFFF